MKILSISGQNIASLKDKFCVEFYSGALKHAGLFSISGKTGSGKSTLFDAMCLALFAETPRLNGNRGKILLTEEENKDKNIFYSKYDLNDPVQIITRGENNAFAEVCFEVKGTCYKARWEIFKKRTNIEHIQKLFEIEKSGCEVEFIPNNHTQKGKQKEIIQKIENIIGLSFPQFKRAVLLAQGEFAQFLKSNTNDKAELLEKITGSEIYTSVAKKAHEEYKKIKKDKEEFEQKKSHLNIKTVEELNDIFQEIERLKFNENLFEKYKTEHLEHKNWLDIEKKISQEIQENSNLLAHKKLEIQKNQEQKEFLQKVKEVQPLKNFYFNMQDHKYEIEKQKIDLSQQNLLHVKINTEVINLKKDELIIRENLRNFLLQKPQIEECISSCEQLDEKIITFSQQHKQEQIDLTFIENEIMAALNEKNNLETELNKNTQIISENSLWLEENKYLEKIKTNKEIIFSNAKQISERYKDIKKINLSIDFKIPLSQTRKSLEDKKYSIQVKLSTVLQELADAQSQISQVSNSKLHPDNEISQLQEKIQIIARINEDKDYYVRFHREMEDLNENFRCSLKTLQEENENYSLIEANLKLKKEQIACLQNDIFIMTAAADIESKRHLLLKKNEECPLCGSTEHPFEHKPSFFNKTLDDLCKDKEAQECQLQNDENLKKISEQNKSNLLKITSTQKEKINNLKRNQEERIELINKYIQLLEEPTIHLAFESFENVSFTSALNNYLISIEKELNFRKEIKNKITNFEQLQKKYHTEISQYTEYLSALDSIILCENFIKENLPAKKFSLENIINFNDKFKENIHKFITLLDEKKASLKKLEEDHEVIKSKIISLDSAIIEKEKNRLLLVKKVQESKTAIIEYTTQRKNLLLEEDTQSYKAQIRAKENQLYKEADEIQSKLHAQELSLEKITTTTTILANALKKEEEKYVNDEEEYLYQLKRNNFENHENIEIFFKYDEKWILQIEKQIEDFDDEVAKLNTLFQKSEADLNSHLNLKKIFINYDEVQEKLIEINKNIKENQSKIGEFKQIINFDQMQREKLVEIESALCKIEPIFKIWDKMIKIIGDASGKSFRIFAQNITLDILLFRANHHLADLRPRYKLERIPNADMEIRIIDLFMGNEMRSVNSLSGGESFLVSLALALALSSLSSKNIRIESLFIDEGFGTLDIETLDTAISILDGLQAQGRKVGIISHVENLNEKIGYQIVVKEKGGGYSEVVCPSN